MKPLSILHGIVQIGNQRGRNLGFPTINIPVNNIQLEGIFISQTMIDKELYNSLTFIGAAKTFNESVFQSETYLFDFTRDVYGKNVTVTILKKLRDNKKFDSEEALIVQMKADKKAAEDFFNHDI